MLETVQERMESYIGESITKIDKAIIAIDLVINKSIAEHEAAEVLFSDFACDGTADNKNHFFDSKIEALKNFINQLIEEKEYLLTLLSQLNGLSKHSAGYPSKYRGGSSFCITVDELAEQVARLENTQRVISSDIDSSHYVLNDTFDGKMIPEIAQMLDIIAEYRTAAMKLKDACQESAGYLKQMEDGYYTCEESLAFGFKRFSEKSESGMQSGEEQAAQSSATSSSPHVQTSHSSPAVNYSKDAEHINQIDTTSGQNSIVPPPRVDNVQFSAVAPNRVVPGKYLPINIIMYEDAFRKAVDDIVRAHGENVKESKSGYHDVERNSLVRVVLTSRDVEIQDGEEEQKWNGKYLNFEFAIKIPSDFSKEQILLSAAVYINDIIATKLKLILDCEKKAKRNISVTREDVFSAFVSYASQDRNRVASIIQGMKKARPDMDIFFDIESLRSGQKWEEALKSEIESRDVLFLCWSRYARESKWVDMEWRYALESKGEDCIEPIPIDSPDDCPPPIELQQKHFNDKMLFIIKATMC